MLWQRRWDEMGHSRDNDLNFNVWLYPPGQLVDLLKQLPAKRRRIMPLPVATLPKVG